MKFPSEVCEVEAEDMAKEAQSSFPDLPLELSPSRRQQLKADFTNGKIMLSPQNAESVRIWLGPHTLYMHSDLFAVSSTVFRMLLENPTSRAVGGPSYSVRLIGEPAVFKLVKHFLHCNLFGQEVTMNQALKLLDFSLYYEIERLIPPAVQIILGKMGPEHALQVLGITRVWEIPELENRALNLISQNAEGLLESKKFKTLGSHDVFRILSLDDLSCTEEQVFNAAFGWAQYEHRRNALKYNFSQMEKCIRFPLMTPAQLAALTTKLVQVLDPTDIVKLFQYVCLPAASRGSVNIKYNTNPRAKCAVSPTTAIINAIPSQPQPMSSTTMITHGESISTPLSSRSGEPEAKRRRMSTPAADMQNLPDHTSHVDSENSGQTSSVSSGVETPATATSRKVAEATEPSGSVSDSEEDDLFTVVTRTKIISDKAAQSFEHLCRKYASFKVGEEEGISGLHFNNCKLEQNHRVIQLTNCNSLKVDTHCNFFKTLSDDDGPVFLRTFVSRFDPMRFISVTRDITKLPTPENIWSFGLDILLKFNGVTFLKVQHANKKEKDALVLNYISDSLEILKNEKLVPSILAISNCCFSLSALKEEGRGLKLEKLVLYRVWGNFTLNEIMMEFPNLTELRLWKHLPPCWFKEDINFIEPLSLNCAANSLPVKNRLNKVSLHKTQLKFPDQCVRSRSLFPCLEELWLENCNFIGSSKSKNRVKIDEVFHNVFPSLRKLVIRERDFDKKGHFAMSRLLNCVLTNIKSIEWVRVVGMKWKIKKLNVDGTFVIEAGKEVDKEDDKLSEFLKQAGLSGCPDSFVIAKVAGGWNGTYLDSSLLDDEEDNMEFEWYDLVNFYDTCECFEDYFLQDDDFPRPQLKY